jgi:hypothetical protein
MAVASIAFLSRALVRKPIINGYLLVEYSLCIAQATQPMN